LISFTLSAVFFYDNILKADEFSCFFLLYYKEKFLKIKYL
jgi:hypothetical protein